MRTESSRVTRGGAQIDGRTPAGATEERVLSPEQVEQFIRRGWVKVEGAIPRRNALAVQRFIWRKLLRKRYLPHDPTTWTKPIVHLKRNYRAKLFRGCATERMSRAIEELVGEGRWKHRDRPDAISWGWWPVNFHVGADRPWDIPTTSWHFDGSFFRHYVHSPEQGLLILCLFSEVQPRGGGTLVAEGSHRLVARFLNEHPEGLKFREALRLAPRSHPWLTALRDPDAPRIRGTWAAGARMPVDKEGRTRVQRFMEETHVEPDGTELRVVEMTGQPGDIIICHPFLYHSASQNHLRIPRFMCNRTAGLKEKMCFDRPDGDYSPLEQSIRDALGMV